MQQMTTDDVCVQVAPGICGFDCTVCIRGVEKRVVALSIDDAQCEQIKKLAHSITHISLYDLFKPYSKNPVFVSAEKAGCHTTCPVPIAILKAVEAAFGVALKSDIGITFKS
jgi:hypothetical protein